MKQKFEEAKVNVILVLSLMMLLFTLCLVLYSDIFQKLIKFNIDTEYSLSGGQDNLSQSLEEIIPYTMVNSPKYLTAYQDKETTLNNIHNDILLYKAINSLNEQELSTSNIQTSLTNLYGSNYFLTHNSFNVNGQDLCLFDKEYNVYSCSTQNQNSITYQAQRKILNINISDLITLKERIIFYSREVIDNLTIYKIYQDGTYQTIVKAFTNQDLENSNMNLDNYLATLDNLAVNYESTFKKINDEHYNWIGTKKI